MAVNVEVGRVANEISRVQKNLKTDNLLTAGYVLVGIGELAAGAISSQWILMGMGAGTILVGNIPIKLSERNETILKQLQKKKS